jgi:hypothetical protein
VSNNFVDSGANHFFVTSRKLETGPSSLSPEDSLHAIKTAAGESSPPTTAITIGVKKAALVPDFSDTLASTFGNSHFTCIYNDVMFIIRKTKESESAMRYLSNCSHPDSVYIQPQNGLYPLSDA